MLLRFSVENFACFAELATLSMVASSDRSHPGHVVEAEAAAGRGRRALRLAALYGANGHGKTRFVEAAMALQRLVLHGVRVDQALRHTPFRLDSALRGQPTRFEIVFRHEDAEYEYGVVHDARRIHDEWLYAREGDGREAAVFVRTTAADGTTTVKQGRAAPKLKRGLFGVLAAGTRMNQPFLTEGAERNVELFAVVRRWFSEVLVPIPATAHYVALPTHARDNPDFGALLGPYLGAADTGIVEVTTEEQPFDVGRLRELPEEERQRLVEACERGETLSVADDEGEMFTLCRGKAGGVVMVRLKTHRRDELGQNVEFDFTDESAGTRRLANLLPIVGPGADGRVYLVDEIDRKLHPVLARELIRHFGDAQASGQLVFTTHNTHLLDLDVLRRDEIWFTSKDARGRASLASLAEFRVRKDLEIEKGYLSGRFGAIPFLGNLRDLGWR